MSVLHPVQAARLESTALLLGCHPVKIVRRENIKILVSSKFARTVLLTLILPHSESHLKQTVKYARMKRLLVWRKAALMHPPASARKLITTLTTSRNALPVLKALTVLFTTALYYHASLHKMGFGDLIRTRLSSATAARGKIYYSLLSLKKLGLYEIVYNFLTFSTFLCLLIVFISTGTAAQTPTHSPPNAAVHQASVTPIPLSIPTVQCSTTQTNSAKMDTEVRSA